MLSTEQFTKGTVKLKTRLYLFFFFFLNLIYAVILLLGLPLSPKKTRWGFCHSLFQPQGGA